MPTTSRTPSAPKSSTGRKKERRMRLCSVERIMRDLTRRRASGDVGDVHVYAHGLVEKIEQERAAQPLAQRREAGFPKMASRSSSCASILRTCSPDAPRRQSSRKNERFSEVKKAERARSACCGGKPCPAGDARAALPWSRPRNPRRHCKVQEGHAQCNRLFTGGTPSRNA